jgi:hypothetical protein
MPKPADLSSPGFDRNTFSTPARPVKRLPGLGLGEPYAVSDIAAARQLTLLEAPAVRPRQ